ncbi:dTDP-glucose 4,6-dehydratase [Streptomyces sp. NPDC051773]|uniref:dTDP-glucose 4,6-dehydratase n=1 Tax=Streptomyces sp. NPDC051773 TaxID=3156682 RepID=UPI00343EC605
MNLLVTGGAGFIGSTYTRMLLDGTAGTLDVSRVTVLDSLTYAGRLDNLDLADPRLSFVRGDICDPGTVAEAMSGADQVVHFAAESHVDRSIEDAHAFARTNVVGTQRLLDQALRQGVDRFVHVSTDEVYGSVVTGARSETDPLDPNSPYAASKAASDLLALSFHRTHGLDVRVTRCSNNYGPRQHPEKVVPLFVTRLLTGRDVPLYGEGRNVRDWLHVEDHCRGVDAVRLRGRPGEIYNIGGGTELTNRELTGLLLDACGRDWQAVRQVPDRKGHDLRYAIHDDKARAECGYRPLVDFDAGLARTVEWYRRHRSWWDR